MTAPTTAPPSALFDRLVASVRDARLRPQVALRDMPAPGRLAPYAFAVSAEVLPAPGASHLDTGRDSDGGQEQDEVLATGRLVVLHDPDGHESWQGASRIVTFVRAELEADIADDPLVGDVGWSWLEEALDDRGARHLAASGTITRVHSQSFGELADRPPTTELEVRASWTPVGDDLRGHTEAWIDLLCTAAGLPPLPSGVVALPSRSAAPRVLRRW